MPRSPQLSTAQAKVLAAIGTAPAAPTAADISRLTGVADPQTRRALDVLERRGYIARRLVRGRPNRLLCSATDRGVAWLRTGPEERRIACWIAHLMQTEADAERGRTADWLTELAWRAHDRATVGLDERSARDLWRESMRSFSGDP